MTPTSGPAPILVVDDDEDILEVVRSTLEYEGYAVALARNGAEALSLLGSLFPRLILLDMRMPVVNGWEFAAAYEAEYGRRSPIVVMSAGRDAAEKASEISAAGYLSKPFDLDALIESVIEHALREA